MRILMDHNVPAQLGRFLYGHTVDRATSLELERAADRTLLQEAVRNGYELVITADKSIKHQQNVQDFQLKVVEISTNHWPKIRNCVDLIQQAIAEAETGRVMEVDIPYEDQR